MVKVKYKEIMNYAFASALQKIAQTPVHGALASQLHKIIKACAKAKQDIQKEFQKDIVGAFAKKDEKGEIVRPEGNPNDFVPLEGKDDEFMKAQEEFGNREAELQCSQITVQMLQDIKISATDLEGLKTLYSGNAEEGPFPGNVHKLADRGLSDQTPGVSPA